MLFENLENRRLMSASLDPVTKVLTVNGTNNDDVIVVSTITRGIGGAKYLSVKENATGKAFLLSSVSKLVVNANGGSDAVTVDANVTLPTVLDSGGRGPDPSTRDVLRGGSGKDIIHLRSDSALGYGGANDDIITAYSFWINTYGEAGNDTLIDKGTFLVSENDHDGGTGVDTIDYSSRSAGLYVKNGFVSPYFTVEGEPPFPDNAYVDGIYNWENFVSGNGNDYIWGNAANNVLKGNGGNDQIHGMAGNDTIYGGTGKDALFGEDGNDTFFSKDAIQDFVSGGTGTDKVNKDAIDILNSVEASF